MVKIVLIRHGNKLHESTNHHYDSPIDKSEWYRGETLFQDYIMKHDIQPTKIICSPYLRTRETASILSRITGLDIEVDIGFSNYIGPRKDFNKDAFDEATWSYKPCRPETRIMFRKRVLYHYYNLINESKQDDVIWVITHRFVISTCVNSARKGLLCTFSPLTGAVIEDDKITWLNDK